MKCWVARGRGIGFASLNQDFHSDGKSDASVLFLFLFISFFKVACVEFLGINPFKIRGKKSSESASPVLAVLKIKATITEHYLKPHRLPPSINVNQRKLEAFFSPPLSGGCLTCIYVGVAGAEPSLRAGRHSLRDATLCVGFSFSTLKVPTLRDCRQGSTSEPLGWRVGGAGVTGQALPSSRGASTAWIFHSSTGGAVQDIRRYTEHTHFSIPSDAHCPGVSASTAVEGERWMKSSSESGKEEWSLCSRTGSASVHFSVGSLGQSTPLLLRGRLRGLGKSCAFAKLREGGGAKGNARRRSRLWEREPNGGEMLKRR